jgi:hypothetical protein
MNDRRSPAPRDEVVDGNLAGVAKTLAGVFTAVAGAATAFGFSQEKLLTAINSNDSLFLRIAGLGLLAVALSMVSLFLPKSKPGNWWQVGFLAAGTGVYLWALYLAITAVADYATGHGRPNITNLSVLPGSPVKINFTVRADGVPNKKAIIVKAQGFKNDGKVENGKLYHAVLRPNNSGDIEQKLEVVWEAGEATRLTILVDQEGTKEIDPTCGPGSDDKLACASILLPVTKKP